MQLRALIVDDEPVVRQGLALMLSESGVNWERIDEAANAREALAAAAKHRHNLVFLDIRMPGPSGLEIMEQLREVSPEARLVILTAYDRFDYAQEALRHGAFDYLVKPVEDEQLHQALQRCIDSLAASEAQRSAAANLKSTCQLLEQYLVHALIPQGTGSQADPSAKPSHRSNSQSCQLHHVCLVIESQDGRADWREWIDTAKDLAWPWGAFGAAVDGRLVLLLSSPAEEPSPERVAELGERMYSGLLERCGTTTLIGIGRPVPDPSSLTVSYAEAIQALEFLKATRNRLREPWLSFSSIKAAGPSNWVYPWEKEEELAVAIRLGRPDQAIHLALQLLDEVIHNSPYVGERQARAAEILAIASRATLSRMVDPREVLHLSCRQLRCLAKVAGETSLREWMRQAITALLALASQTGMSHAEQMVAEAEAYVQKHLGRSITLKEVARTVCLSPSYFSTLFRKQTGTSFKAYLERVRLKKAIDLLLNTDAPICEIARQVGYDDANYFARVFRKAHGIAPTEFRRRHRPRDAAV